MLRKLLSGRKKPLCTHSHTINDHPQCFVNGLVNSNEVWWNSEGHKIGVLDIETSGLRADFLSVMLTWCIKDKGQDTIYFDKVTKQELFSGVLDKRLVESLVNRLKEYKIIIGYFSNGFDIPYIRTKAIHYGVPFPGYQIETTRKGNKKLVPSLYSWDLYPVVKHKLRMSRNSLDATCEYFGIPGKTPIGKEAWLKATYGDEESLEKVLEHNKADVVITDELHTKLCDFYKWGRTSI